MAEWTTKDVRERILHTSALTAFDVAQARRRGERFDAWLAAHDAEVRAQAVQEFRDALPDGSQWLAEYTAGVRAQTLRDYAASRYEAYLEDPSIPWPDQPSRLAQSYAMCAAELRTAADREAEGGAQ